MKSSVICRADLLIALSKAGELGNVPVGLLGYERKKSIEASKLEIEPTSAVPPKRMVKTSPISKSKVEFQRPKFGQRILRFLLPAERTAVSDDASSASLKCDPLDDDELEQPKGGSGFQLPLTSWTRLGPFLRRQLGVKLASHRIDQRKLSRLVAEGLPMLRLPRLMRQSWGHGACLIWDTSPEMEPFVPDVAVAVRRLKRERGRHGLKLISSYGPPQNPLSLNPSVPVVAFSALGQLCRADSVQESWARLGIHLGRAGHRLTALTPCPRKRWHVSSSIWPSAVWDRRPSLPRQLSQPVIRCAESAIPATSQADLLLDLLSPATIITPGLLREVRLLIGSSADVGAEYDAWFDSTCSGEDSIRYFSFRPGTDYEMRLARRRLLAQSDQTRNLVRQATEAINRHLGATCSKVIAGEAKLRALITERTAFEDFSELKLLLERAVERMRILADTPGSLAGRSSGLPIWFMSFVEERLTKEMRSEPPLAEVIAQGWVLARKFLGCLEDTWPDQINEKAALEELRNHSRRSGAQLARLYRIGLDGATLVVEPSNVLEPAKLHSTIKFKSSEGLTYFSMEDKSRLHPLMLGRGTQVIPVNLTEPSGFTLESNVECVKFVAPKRPAWAERMWYDKGGVKALAKVDGISYTFVWTIVWSKSQPTETFRWMGESKPKWAHTFWADQFGIAASFSIQLTPFVLRWIPPGRFTMGSPEDEPGRNSWEGPQHEVTISRGYWLGETPVTQAQWRAVVEAGRADKALWKKFGSKDLKSEPSEFKGPSDLPVEQVNWLECRDFCGLLTSLMQASDLQFHLPSEAQWEYACRAGTETAFNDGSACTEPEAHDPALDRLGWFHKNSGGKTHVVKEKNVPNAWGLHDMHGNVWEWCADQWQEDAYKKRADGVTDPRHDSAYDSAGRVIRGGSWGFHARYCRSAYRGWVGPGSRWRDRGLRLAAGQELGGGAAGSGAPSAGEAAAVPGGPKADPAQRAKKISKKRK